MIRNYIIISIRSLLRNRAYAIINILGLALGLITCLFIFLLIRFESSFEKMHTGNENIYRVVQDRGTGSGINHNAQTPYPLIHSLDGIAGIKEKTRIHYQGQGVIRIDDRKFLEEEVIFADSNFFEMFNYGDLRKIHVMGSLERSINEPGFAILSESTARKYFGDINPLGQRLMVNNLLEVEVGAITKDIPANTHLQYNILISYASLTPAYTNFPLDSWNFVSSGYTYVRLQKDVYPKELEEAVNPVLRAHYNEESRNVSFYLQPLNEIHFDEVYANGLSTTTVSKQYLTIITAIGIFILLIACINFINISTALGLKKGKEVGVRKVLGARRKNLIGQYIGEAFVLTISAALICLLVMPLAIPFFNSFFNKALIFDLGNDLMIWLVFISLIIIISLFSGSYPAFVISRFDPVTALKNKINSHSKGSIYLRKSLVVFQFLVAQGLIISTLIIASQMSYIKNKNIGFNKEAVINVGIPQPDSVKLKLFYDRLDQHQGISGISFNLGAPTSENNIGTPYYETSKGNENQALINVKPVDHMYKEVYGLELIAGRWLEENDATSSVRKMILNEQGVKKLGYASPEDVIGVNITTGFGGQSGEIVGVVNDFHLSSFHNEIIPVCFTPENDLYYNMGLKLQPNQYPEAIKKVEETFNELYPDDLFQYSFMDQQLAQLYEEDGRTYGMFTLFSGIAIFIGCLGLIGLISFLIEQKKKEVGIRKVLGASISSIVYIFSKEYASLIVISFILAAPAAYSFAYNWLSNFAYRTEIEPVYFVVGGLAAVLIAFIAVSWQAFKAAFEDPVKNLKAD